jgi:hypothetical protein
MTNVSKTEDKTTTPVVVNAPFKPEPKSMSIKAEPSKSKFVKLPNGTRLRTFVMSACSPTNTGVSITNSAGAMIGFIDATDVTERELIMDLLDECMSGGKKFVQPDWSFLNS